MVAACGTPPQGIPRIIDHDGMGVPALIPFEAGAADAELLVGRICRSDSPGRRPVVVINHGAPGSVDKRRGMQPTRCDTEVARWFTDRGYLVIFPLRRGFGGSTGPAVEDRGACDRADYLASGLSGAKDIDATLRFAAKLPYAQPTGAIVIGQSTGGWATVAYDSIDHPTAAAFINFAGGRGGHSHSEAPTNCQPDLLIDAARRFGKNSVTPMLWVYARNDTFFPSSLVSKMYNAFVQAGGKADLFVAPAFANEGHWLFQGPGGSAIWGAIIENYLANALPL